MQLQECPANFLSVAVPLDIMGILRGEPQASEMMHKEPLLGGSMPLYEQLKHRLRSEIARGVYRPGDRLPSEPELINRYGISRITVRQALGDLEAEGLVVRRHGKGTYVAEQPAKDSPVRLVDFMQDMTLAGLTPTLRVLRLAREGASRDLAEALHLAPGSEVVRVDRLRLANEQPIAVDSTWLPLRYGALLVDGELTKKPIYRLLETTYGVLITTSAFHLTAAAATAEQAHLLTVPGGSPLLLIQRISSTEHDEPVYLQDRYYRPDRVHYVATLQRQGAINTGGQSLQELRPVFRDPLTR
jgi:GntR family transcriptional regulator